MCVWRARYRPFLRQALLATILQSFVSPQSALSEAQLQFVISALSLTDSMPVCLDAAPGAVPVSPPKAYGPHTRCVCLCVEEI